MTSPTYTRTVEQPYNAQALVDARKASGLSLRAAAAKIGTSYVYLQNVEKGIVKPTEEFIERVCECYGITKKSVSSSATTITSTKKIA